MKNEVLVVCSGNTCRSPMLKALLRDALEREDEPLCSLQVGSAGIYTTIDEPAHPNAVEVVAELGIDLSNHRSRSLTPARMWEALVVLVMTVHHGELLVGTGPGPGPREVRLVRQHLDGADVVDPFNEDLERYRETRDSLREAVPGIIEYLKERVS